MNGVRKILILSCLFFGAVVHCGDHKGVSMPATGFGDALKAVGAIPIEIIKYVGQSGVGLLSQARQASTESIGSGIIRGMAQQAEKDSKVAGTVARSFVNGLLNELESKEGKERSRVQGIVADVVKPLEDVGKTLLESIDGEKAKQLMQGATAGIDAKQLEGVVNTVLNPVRETLQEVIGDVKVMTDLKSRANELNAAVSAIDSKEISNQLQAMVVPPIKEALDEVKETVHDATGNMRAALGDLKNLIEEREAYIIQCAESIRQSSGGRAVANFFHAYNQMTPAQRALTVVGAIAITYGTYCGTGLLFEKLREYLAKPTILLPGSHVGRMDSWRRWRDGYETPAMIASPHQRARLQEILQKTRMMVLHKKQGKKIAFDNLILSGDPGTGKTLFAQVLADKADMYFAPTTAGALLQGTDAVKHINDLIAMAKKSNKPVMIFIDEADALFADRDKLDVNSQHYKLLNHVLALTGQGTDQFMFVAATNYSKVFDSAMSRRFQDRVDFVLPDAEKRAALLKLYIGQVLLNANNDGEKFVKDARVVLNQIGLQKMVSGTEGLSDAEIANVVHAMRKKALITKNDLLTSTHVLSAIAEAVEKRQRFDADKKVRA